MATFCGVGGGAVGSCWGASDQYFGRSAPAARPAPAALALAFHRANLEAVAQ